MTDLSSLPEISFLETDSSLVEQSIINLYQTMTGRTLYPGNPERLFCETVAFVISQQRVLIDQAAKQNLLAYSTGEYLDHLGALLDVTRLESGAATVTLRFSIDSALAFPVAIPEGTRATPGNQIYFATDETAEITAGNTYVDVTATCTETGAGHNGYVAGQINRLVDVSEYVTSVTNTTMSLSGSNAETDDHFRTRIQLAPEKFSVAGPDLAYAYWAYTADPEIIDVSVRSPNPGEVDVRVLMTGGALPDSDILGAVEAVLSDRNRRPLTDTVTVAAPDQISYDIDLTYYLPSSKSSLVSQYQAAVNAAVESYVAWQKAKLGRDINPSRLIYLIQAAGAKRVTMTTPTFQALELYEVATEGTVTVNYGGLEDE